MEHTAGCVPVSPCTVKVYVVVLLMVSVAIPLRVGYVNEENPEALLGVNVALVPLA